MTTSSFTERLKQTLRQPQVWGFFLSMAVMAVVSLAFFAPDNFDGNVLSQHDMQQGAANGEEGRAYAELTGEKALWTNSLFSGMPTFQISPDYPSNALFSWLNTVYGLGLPSPSNLLFMMMFGMLILCYCCRLRWWYALIGALAWGLSTYFVIIIGAGHIWKFLALTYVPPTIGGILLAYRGKYLWGAALSGLFTMLQLNANHPQITYYSLYIIGFLAIAFLIGAIMRRKMKKWLYGSVACLVGGCLAIGANSPSLYNTYEYSKETKRAQSELVDVSATKSDDSGERPTGGLPKTEIGGWSNMPSESVSLLVPNVKGGATIRPQQGSNVYLSLADLEAYKQSPQMQADDVFGLMPQMGQYFGGKGMTNGPFYFGAIIVALFLLGCLIVRGPVKWALLGVTLLSICLAMGNHFPALTDFMIYNVPMYNKFRAAETALVIAALCMPLLGVMGLQKFLSTPNALRRYRIRFIIAFGVPALICLVLAIAPGILGAPFSAEEEQVIESWRTQMHGSFELESLERIMDNIAALRLGMVTDDALRSLLFVALGAVTVFLGALHVRNARASALVVALLVTVDLYSVDKRYISHDSFVEGGVTAVDPLGADAIDNEILKDKGYYRVADLVDFGGHRRSFYHHMVGGYHAAKLNRYEDIIQHRLVTALAVHDYIPEARFDTLPADIDHGTAEVLTRLRADYRVLDMLNAKYIITHKGLTVNPGAMGPAWLVGDVRYVDGARAEMAALATLDPRSEAVADGSFKDVLGEEAVSLVPGDTIALKKYTPNTVSYDVTTAHGGIAVFSEVWFPWGWKATVDGEPAHLGRVNYILRAMRVPAGKHEVTLTFDPDSLHVTGAIAYACVTLIYLLLATAMFVTYTRRFGTRKK